MFTKKGSLFSRVTEQLSRPDRMITSSPFGQNKLQSKQGLLSSVPHSLFLRFLVMSTSDYSTHAIKPAPTGPPNTIYTI